MLAAMIIAGGVAAIINDNDCVGLESNGSVLGAVALWTADSMTALGGLSMIITSSAIRGLESKTGPVTTTLGLDGTF